MRCSALHSGQQQVVGVSGADESAHVLVTVQSHGVLVFHRETSELVRSWLVRPGTTFTQHAVETHDGTFFAVQEGKFLCSWTLSTDSLETVPTHALDDKVVGLFAVRHVPSTACVVFAGGVVVLVNSALKVVHRHNPRVKGVTLWASLVSGESYQTVVTLAAAENGALSLHWYSIHKANLQLAGSVDVGAPPSKDDTPVALSVDEQYSAVYILWSSGALERVGVDAKLASHTRTSVVRLVAPQAAPVSLNAPGAVLKSGVCMTTLRDHVVAVVGRFKTPSDADAARPVALVVETAFGTVQEHDVLPLPSTSAASAPGAAAARGPRRPKATAALDTLDLSSNGGASAGGDARAVSACVLSQGGAAHGGRASTAAVALTRSVVLVTSESGEPSLAAALGRRAVSEYVDARSAEAWVAAHAVVDLNEVVRQLADASSGGAASRIWSESVEKKEAEESRVLTALVDEAATPTLESFMRVFTPFLAAQSMGGASASVGSAAAAPSGKSSSSRRARKQATDDAAAAAPTEASDAAPATDALQRPRALAPYFVNSVAQRCVKSRFWQPLRTLLETRAVSAFSVPALLPAIIEENNLELLDVWLVFVQDIPESDLVRVLQYIVQSAPQESLERVVPVTPDDVIARSDDSVVQQHYVPRIGGDSAREAFLALALSVPRSVDQVAGPLRRLPLDVVVELLQVCIKWLERHGQLPVNALRSTRTVPVPTLPNLLDWVSVLLDAHLNALVLTKSTHTLLRRLRGVISNERSLCERLTLFRGYLAHFAHRHAMPDANLGSDFVTQRLPLF